MINVQLLERPVEWERCEDMFHWTNTLVFGRCFKCEDIDFLDAADINGEIDREFNLQELETEGLIKSEE